MRSIAVVCSAVIGVAFLMSPAFAQEKRRRPARPNGAPTKLTIRPRALRKRLTSQNAAGATAQQNLRPRPRRRLPRRKREKDDSRRRAGCHRENGKGMPGQRRANKADNQAKGITEKAYVTQCRAGTAAAQPAPAPAPKTTAAPPPAAAPEKKTTAAPAPASRARKEDGDRSHGTAARRDGANRRQPVHDRSASQGALRDRNGRVGQPGFEDLSLRVLQELRQHKIRRVHVRAGCDRPGNARLQE